MANKKTVLPTIFAMSAVLHLSGILVADLAHAEEQRSIADDREFRAARPQTAHLIELVNAELSRLMTNSKDPPSPAIQELMSAASRKGPSLGDTTVALHLRLVERERLSAVAAVTWARSPEGHCDDPDFGPAQLLDAKFRHYMFEVLKCRAHALDYYQSGMAKLSKADEVSIVELKLTPFEQQQMLSAVRASSASQSASIAPLYRNRRDTNEAIMDVFQYMDSHPAHLLNQQIIFDNDKDRPEGERIYNRFIAALKSAQ